ncbi:MAG: hybrid sensor histidine kinase/response regulator [Flaviaesturariibacter sp.]|nr:hybrid sensor histidine kinase/response regulator [Flaviaesturariibacter sp.]
MTSMPIPVNENLRLEDLYSYGVLDTPAESDFDQLTELATLICGCDMSLVSLVDRQRVWFKAKKGIDFPESPRELSMCSHVIMQDEVLVIENPLTDERFFDLPGVISDPNVRFYAGAPIRSSKGFHLGTVCVFDSNPKNITDTQVKALHRLARQASILLEFRKKNEELKCIAQEQLELKQQAETASKVQKQFLSTMSHEIRTPLNGVIGMTNLLLLEEPAPHQLEYLSSLKFASENLLNVVNDVLDYSKITSENLVFEKARFNLFRLLQDIANTHAVAAKAKGISIELNTDLNVPEWVAGDSARLTQVLNNLLGNAIKFTTNGGVKLRLQLADTTATTAAVRFEVTDSGIGIDPSQLDNIFEQFTQANAGITRNFGGTGLGLAITKKLLEMQGSTIAVSSTPGQGSTFFFTLTFDRSSEIPVAKTTDMQTDQLRGLKVLIVEDNKLNWVVLRKYLSAWEVEAELAENGAIALEKVSQNNYHAIFMDLQMPVMDGFTASKKLRDEHAYTGPIVAITADAYANQDHDLAAYGFTDSVVKPFERSELATKLVKLVTHSRTIV